MEVEDGHHCTAIAAPLIGSQGWGKKKTSFPFVCFSQRKQTGFVSKQTLDFLMNVLGQQLMSHGAGVPTTRRIEMPFDTRQHGGVILDLSNRENKRCWGYYWSHACLSIKTKNKERKDSGVRGLKLQMGRTGKCKCKTKATYKKNKTGSETNKQNSAFGANFKPFFQFIKCKQFRQEKA